MLRRHKKVLIVLAILAVLIGCDFAYSLLSTCQPTNPSTPQQGGYENNCTTLGGFIPWIASVTLNPLSRFLETYEHPLVAGFTIVLAFSTILLWVVTKQAADAARDATEISRDAFTKMERPYIYIFEAYGIETDYEGPDPFEGLRYAVANFGKTPAQIKDFRASISVGKAPVKATTTDTPYTIHSSPILPPDDIRKPVYIDLPRGISCEVSDDGYGDRFHKPKIPPGLEFFFHIVIGYCGPFSTGHETSACWQWDKSSNRLVQYGDAEYNYTR